MQMKSLFSLPIWANFRNSKSIAKFFEISLTEGDVLELEKQDIGNEESNLEQPAPPSIQKTSLLKALKISTVDNFQGEEAKVVVVSLVRSNDQNKCGFLRTSNRINVLLSRAKTECTSLEMHVRQAMCPCGRP